MKYLNIEKSIVIFSRKKKHFIGNFSKNISIKNTLNRNNIQCTSSHVMCFSAMVRERVREWESERVRERGWGRWRRGGIKTEKKEIRGGIEGLWSSGGEEKRQNPTLHCGK